MRRWLWLLCLPLVACVPPRAQVQPPPRQELAGTLAGEVVLGGELELSGDLRIPKGSRLTIQPGTTIWVRPAESTKIDPEYLSPLTEILVHGELLVVGTEAAPVRFRTLPSIDPVAAGDPLWAGIEVIGGATRLEHLQLSRADVGVLVQGGLAEVSQSHLTGCRTGLAVQTGGALNLADSRVEGGETGLFCWSGGTLSFARSQISGHAEEGVYLAAGCESAGSNLRVNGNDRGLVAGRLPEAGIHPSANRLDVMPLRNGEGR